MDEVSNEGNGPMDLVAAIATGKAFNNPPKFIGAIHNRGRKQGTDLPFVASIMDRLKQGIRYGKGTEKAGYNQGHSDVSKAIVEFANKGTLFCCTGGSYTDIAIAVRNNPEIRGNVVAVGIEASNVEEDRASYNYLVKQGVKIYLFKGNEYRAIIKGAQGKWLEQHVRPTPAGDIVLAKKWLDQNKKNNGGSLNFPTSARFADVMTVVWALTGSKSKAMDSKYVYPMLEKGLKELR